MDKLIGLLKNSNAFCVMPWVHLHISSNGDMMPCCVATKPFGNIGSSKIKDVWNGDEINEFRKKLIDDIKSDGCKACYFTEASGSRSLRQHFNEVYSSRFLEISRVERTSDSKEAHPPIYWDIRLSNVCNFRCRTCYHGASSRWFDEAVKMGETLSNKPIIRACDDLEAFYTQIEESIDCVEEIYFAGGEPLMMEEHYRILQILEAKNSFDKYLRYSTNFSKFTYKEIDVFKVWSKFKKVHVAASLDASGRRGELIRKEQNWDEVLRNRERMKQICPNVSFCVSVTVSALNIFHIPDFHRELVATNFISVDDFFINNLLHTPQFYNMQILPFEFKMKIKEKFEKHIEWVDAMTAEISAASRSELFQGQFKNCINYLFANDLSEYMPQFVSRCKQLDALRNEKTAEVFPELEFMF